MSAAASRFFTILCALFACEAFAAERPNILFVLTEDQGAHLSLLGTPGLKTPHMDALAKSGTYFSNAFVAYPVCSASKAAIYTGLHNHINGILNNTHNFHMPADQVSDAQYGDERNRLIRALRGWVESTNDPAISP